MRNKKQMLYKYRSMLITKRICCEDSNSFRGNFSHAYLRDDLGEYVGPHQRTLCVLVDVILRITTFWQPSHLVPLSISEKI